MTKSNRINSTPPGEGGTPLRTVVLAGGMRQHTMADGRVLEEDGPNFKMEYKSYMPGDTYMRDIALFGLAEDKHLIEAWCYVYKALRTYAFSKIISLEEIATGKKLTGEELREHMGGEHPMNRT